MTTTQRRTDIIKKTVTLPDGGKASFTFVRRDYPRWMPGRYIPGTDGRRGWTTRGSYSSTEKDFNKKPRLYVGVEETLLENLENRTTRPVLAWGRMVRAAMVTAGYTGKVGWYAKAGCSMCPCSPGFIWTDAPELTFPDGTTTRRYDVSVSLQGAPVKRDDDAARAQQRGRRRQLENDPTLPINVLAATRL